MRTLMSRMHVGERWLAVVGMFASLLAVAACAAIAYQAINGSTLAMSHFGLGFLTHETWKPNFNLFGAAPLIYGTAITSAMALAVATPLGIAIGLSLSLLMSRRASAVIGPLVEMLAAIPSVILGFWGILVLAPFVRAHVEPWLHARLGFVPLFGHPATTGSGIFTASLVLSIMVVPIVASISRDLFLAVPRELADGATALGATRWEVVRGVILPATGPGLAAAAVLGLGRALGEAIAVTQVIGAGTGIHGSLFTTGDTLASRIADQFQGATTALHQSALFYLATILLGIGLTANLLARRIAQRFSYGGAVAT